MSATSTSSMININNYRLLLSLALLIFPISFILWYKIKTLNTTLIAILRMILQLSFVGFYLHFVFTLNNFFLTLAWLIVMTVVADFSVINHCEMKLKYFWRPLLIALIIGIMIPMSVFTLLVINSPALFEAKLVIPVTGMLLGNSLSANIVGLNAFFEQIRRDENRYMLTLAQGATFTEALRVYIADALKMALKPTTASMATIGLVTLPGMMTGLILGGASPVEAVKYQIGIMIAIFSATALTVLIGLKLSIKSSFFANGLLDKSRFKN
ncbi:ABC transporter permease [Lentisphaerota bacterium WC36G]|nr:ABC transporter permease [Lentisphaerae bacterium WC36]